MRLDAYLISRGYFETRTKAKQSIEKGEVILDGKVITKPSFFVDESNSCNITINRESSYVSLGGYKLEKALNDFKYKVNNLTVVDVGSSTGGFTDCLLQHGAKKVYCVDLNNQLLHHSLKEDNRVVEIIKNAKELSLNDFNEEIDLVVADLSFISASVVLPVISDIIDIKKDIILLIKPQFENDKKINFKNGIVKDKKTRFEACKKIIDCAINNNLFPHNFTNAPLQKDKNTEYLVLLRKAEKIKFNLENYFDII